MRAWKVLLVAIVGVTQVSLGDSLDKVRALLPEFSNVQPAAIRAFENLTGSEIEIELQDGKRASFSAVINNQSFTQVTMRQEEWRFDLRADENPKEYIGAVKAFQRIQNMLSDHSKLDESALFRLVLEPRQANSSNAYQIIFRFGKMPVLHSLRLVNKPAKERIGKTLREYTPLSFTLDARGNFSLSFDTDEGKQAVSGSLWERWVSLKGKKKVDWPVQHDFILPSEIASGNFLYATGLRAIAAHEVYPGTTPNTPNLMGFPQQVLQYFENLSTDRVERHTITNALDSVIEFKTPEGLTATVYRVFVEKEGLVKFGLPDGKGSNVYITPSAGELYIRVKDAYERGYQALQLRGAKAWPLFEVWIDRFGSRRSLVFQWVRDRLILRSAGGMGPITHFTYDYKTGAVVLASKYQAMRFNIHEPMAAGTHAFGVAVWRDWRFPWLWGSVAPRFNFRTNMGKEPLGSHPFLANSPIAMTQQQFVEFELDGILPQGMLAEKCSQTIANEPPPGAPAPAPVSDSTGQ